MQTSDRKNQLILITRNFPPLVGGMEKLNYHMAKELTATSRVHIIGPKGAEQFLSNSQTIDTCPTSLFGFLIFGALKAIRLAPPLRASKLKNTNIILAGSGVSAPIAWLLSRLIGCPWGVYLHGLDIIVDSHIYRHLFLPVIRVSGFVIVNSSATKNEAERAGIPASKITVVNPGVAMPPDKPTNPKIAEFRNKLGISSGPLLLSVGRLTQRKGLKEFIIYSLPRIAHAHPDVRLLVVGSEPSNALLRNSVGRPALEKAAQKAKVIDNIIFLGNVSEPALEMLYHCADIHVFPIIPTPGDMEGFGMVAIEAAARGLPTIAFAEGGVVDAVSHGESGYLIPSGAYESFAQQTVRLLCDKQLLNPDTVERFARQFAWPVFGEKIRKLVHRRDQ